MMSLNHQWRAIILTIVSPTLRLFPPWWKARFYGRIVGDYFGMVEKKRVKRRRVSPHNYKMELQLDDPMERFAYYVGCYWGIDVAATVCRLLRPKDYFVDVGSNLGFLTLTASKQVGRHGKVFSFEPFSAMADRLERTLLNNSIDNVILHKYALGEIEAEGRLDYDDHCSKANLRSDNENGAIIKIVRGDEILFDFPEEIWVFAKLDVEGYELRVLKGLNNLLKRSKTGFLVEISDLWLRDLGGSAGELFELMQDNGFKAFLPKLTCLSKFELRPINYPQVGKHHYDVVFLRPEEDWLSR